MHPEQKVDISQIALAAIHRQMVTLVTQLDALAARSDAQARYEEAAHYVSLSNHAVDAFAELKRRLLH